MSALAFPKLGNVKCYSQQDILWDTVLVGTKTLSSSKLVGDTMYNVGCIVTSAAMEAGTYNIYLPDFNYGTGLLTGTSSQASPKNLNYWLYNHNGFTGSNIIFEAMAGLSCIYGLWQSKLHFDVTVAGIYSTARDMIAGTFNTYIKPSLPIAHLGKTLNGEWIDHYCAWYGSDGSLSNPRNNLIVQPTLTNYSNDSLKCTFVCGAGNKYYSPVTAPDLMRVAWKN